MNEMEQIPEGWERADPRHDRLENAADCIGARRHRHRLRHDHCHGVRWAPFSPALSSTQQQLLLATCVLLPHRDRLFSFFLTMHLFFLRVDWMPWRVVVYVLLGEEISWGRLQMIRLMLLFDVQRWQKLRVRTMFAWHICYICFEIDVSFDVIFVLDFTRMYIGHLRISVETFEGAINYN